MTSIGLNCADRQLEISGLSRHAAYYGVAKDAGPILDSMYRLSEP